MSSGVCKFIRGISRGTLCTKCTSSKCIEATSDGAQRTVFVFYASAAHQEFCPILLNACMLLPTKRTFSVLSRHVRRLASEPDPIYEASSVTSNPATLWTTGAVYVEIDGEACALVDEQ